MCTFTVRCLHVARNLFLCVHYKYEQKIWRSTGPPLQRVQVSPQLVSECVLLNIL